MWDGWGNRRGKRTKRSEGFNASIMSSGNTPANFAFTGNIGMVDVDLVNGYKAVYAGFSGCDGQGGERLKGYER